MCFLFKAVAVPGGNISPPLYESTESCESLLQVERQPDLSSQQNIFSHDYGLQVDIMLMLKAKQASCLLASWLVSFVLCLG